MDNEQRELLQQLKKEIYRLGLQDFPSRTKYSKLYDKNNAPAATTVMYKLKMNWGQILKAMDMGEFANRRAPSKLKNTENMGRPKSIQDKEGLQLLTNDICYYTKLDKVKTLEDFTKMLKKRNLPSIATLYNYRITWAIIKKKTEEKYGYKFINRNS